MATTETSHQVLIGGTFTDSVSGATMDVINPATGEKIAQVPSCTAEDVDNAVQAAKDALPEWLDTTPGEHCPIRLGWNGKETSVGRGAGEAR